MDFDCDQPVSPLVEVNSEIDTIAVENEVDSDTLLPAFDILHTEHENYDDIADHDSNQSLPALEHPEAHKKCFEIDGSCNTSQISAATKMTGAYISETDYCNNFDLEKLLPTFDMLEQSEEAPHLHHKIDFDSDNVSCLDQTLQTDERVVFDSKNRILDVFSEYVSDDCDEKMSEMCKRDKKELDESVELDSGHHILLTEHSGSIIAKINSRVDKFQFDMMHDEKETAETNTYVEINKENTPDSNKSEVLPSVIHFEENFQNTDDVEDASADTNKIFSKTDSLEVAPSIDTFHNAAYIKTLNTDNEMDMASRHQMLSEKNEYEKSIDEVEVDSAVLRNLSVMNNEVRLTTRAVETVQRNVDCYTAHTVIVSNGLIAQTEIGGMSMDDSTRNRDEISADIVPGWETEHEVLDSGDQDSKLYKASDRNLVCDLTNIQNEMPAVMDKPEVNDFDKTHGERPSCDMHFKERHTDHGLDDMAEYLSEKDSCFVILGTLLVIMCMELYASSNKHTHASETNLLETSDDLGLDLLFRNEETRGRNVRQNTIIRSKVPRKRKKQQQKQFPVLAKEKKNKKKYFAENFEELRSPVCHEDFLTDDVDNGLTCAVCLDMYYRPTQCQPCGHIFCDPCLRRLTGQGSEGILCPLCRTVIRLCNLDKEFHEQLKISHPDIYNIRHSTEKRSRYRHFLLPFTPPVPLSKRLLRHLVTNRTNAPVNQGSLQNYSKLLFCGLAGACISVLIMLFCHVRGVQSARDVNIMFLSFFTGALVTAAFNKIIRF